ncbi:MAG: mannose-1-phosphate guanylyltransferase/mannose-6-phosphate isomerase [Methylococcales bacterium]
MNIKLQPVILSGGAGTRLWPYSRAAFPKQFLPLAGETTLLQETVNRVDQFDGNDEIELGVPLVVCNDSHRFLVAEQLRHMGYDDSKILLEPVGRNTAPAMTLAALLVNEQAEDPVLAVMPSDHLVQNEAGFKTALVEAALLAQEGYLVTFGIVPSSPETGFGYIRKGSDLSGTASTVSAFVEKPDETKAREYVDSGQYLWNSGIFIVRASIWLKEIERFRPDIFEACTDALKTESHDGDFVRIDAKVFSQCPSDSIDYAVMEKITGGSEASSKAAVIPLDVGWSDLGSWPALREVLDQDEAGNVVRGDVFVKDAKNTLVLSQRRFVAAIGVEDLVVIETPDAVLVAHRDAAQDVKAITDHLSKAGRLEHVFHSKVHRPWGNYEAIDEGARYQVKRLTVKPGERLSSQLHHHRAEHWVVVSGTAKVTCGEETFLLTENQSTYISVGTVHRLENPGTIPLEIIEVQSGSYLGEDDIVRFEDIYNRVET